MINSFRVAVADDNRVDLLVLREYLTRAGHLVALEAASGEELIKKCATCTPDLIITDIHMPGLDGLEAVRQVIEDHEIPVIVVSGGDLQYFLERVDECRPLAYLTKPVREEELRAAIAVAMSRFEELQSLRAQATSMRQALEDRKIIERAKGLLMQRRSLGESAAFNFLQSLARSRRVKLVDVANSLMLTENVLSIDGNLAANPIECTVGALS